MKRLSPPRPCPRKLDKYCPHPVPVPEFRGGDGDPRDTGILSSTLGSTHHPGKLVDSSIGVHCRLSSEAHLSFFGYSRVFES